VGNRELKASSDSLLTVINDILDFSQIEAGKIDLDAVDFNLHDSLESTLKTVAIRADEKGLELLCEVAPEVPEIVCRDSTRLRQVVMNLVSNAIKFTQQGEVAVKVQMESRDATDGVLHFYRIRHRDRNPQGKTGADFRSVFASGLVHHQEVRWNRARIDHFHATGADDGRENLGGKRRGPGQPVSLHGAAGSGKYT
jgi:signal transduction histidine kinase